MTASIGTATPSVPTRGGPHVHGVDFSRYVESPPHGSPRSVMDAGLSDDDDLDAELSDDDDLPELLPGLEVLDPNELNRESDVCRLQEASEDTLSSGLTMKYDQEQPIEGVEGVVKIFTAGPDGLNEARISVKVCRMGFLNNLLFAKAGDCTGGAEVVD